MPGKSGEPATSTEAKRDREEETTSASRIVSKGDAKKSPGRSGRDSDRPSFRALTPYQARLDVEMDDTAVSKVRDPSVSISLGAEHAIASPVRRLWKRRPEAVTSIALGVLLGVFVVLVLAILVRVFG